MGQDLTGQQFGRLMVTAREENRKGKQYYRCLCACGKETVVEASHLKGGHTRSCGCLQKEQRKENMEKAIHFADGTCVERIASRKTSANNTTGHRGVYRRKNNRWRACIGFQGKVYHLGNFSNYEDAVKARLEAENRLYDTFLEEYAKKKV